MTTPPADTLYGWFAASAARHPDAVALEAGGERFSYRDLEDYAAHLAAALLSARGGTPPRRVGLLAGRTPLAYAGYLAVLRTGATVVPLNPAWPDARNNAVISAGALEIVLTDTDGPAGSPAPLLNLATARAEAAPAIPPAAAAPDPLDTAYILFTSGTTGTPKGVPIQHGNISAYLAHVVPHYGLGPGARLSQTFDLTFDVSVLDMFLAWASGAALVVPDKNDVLAPVRFVTQNAITHWCSVPSVISFARRMRALRPGSMPTLRHSVFAGEPLTLQQAAAWQAAAPGSTVDNLYGPTELTVTCTGFRLPADQDDWPRTANGTVPIGQVHPQVEHTILDEHGRPAPEGELCLRGPQRFPGYLDPADNAGRFWDLDATDPQPQEGTGPVSQGSWYRTGDRVRREDDQLVHLGRLDHQVKIAGYRVELGEIEAVLREQSAVHDAVALALAPDQAQGQAELHAVCTGERPDTEALLGALRLRLPVYMVPRTLRVVDRLPLNGNGKIDRAALATLLTTGSPIGSATG